MYGCRAWLIFIDNQMSLLLQHHYRLKNHMDGMELKFLLLHFRLDVPHFELSLLS
jgi:hypothetical protein